jgi:MFS family permease
MSSIETTTAGQGPAGNPNGNRVSTQVSQTLTPVRARVNLFSVSSAHAVIHATVVLMPLIYPILHTQYGFTYTEIGLLTSIPNLLGGLLQVAFGYLGRYVSRKLLIGVGNVFVGISMFLTGTATTFGPFLGWGVLRSTAGAPQHPVGSAMLTDTYPPQRRGFALAAHVAGGNLGTLVVPAIGTYLITRFGWQPALMLFALPGLLAGTLVVIFAKEPGRVVRTTRAETASKSRRGRWLTAATRPLQHRVVVLVIVASMVAAGGRGLGVLTTYLPLYLGIDLKLNSTVVGFLFTVLLIGSVVGPLFGGRISDAIGPKSALLGTYFLAAPLMLLLPLVGTLDPEVWLLFLAVALVGLSAYIESPLLQAYLADASPDDERDAAFGWYFTLAFGVGSLWGTAVGALIDYTGSFPLAFVAMALSYAAAGVVVLFIPRIQRT